MEMFRDDEVICASSDEWRRATVSNVLEQAGYRVRPCPTTRELLQLAARRFRAKRPCGDLLLLDEELDSTFSASKILAAFQRVGVHVRTVILAPSDRGDQIIECLRLGAADYIHVPAEPAEILDVVDRVSTLPAIR